MDVVNQQIFSSIECVFLHCRGWKAKSCISQIPVLLKLQMQIRFSQLVEIWKAEVKWRSSSCCLHCFLFISAIVKIGFLCDRFQHPNLRVSRGYWFSDPPQ